MTRRKRLGEVLIDAGLINETQLAAALNSQRTWGGKLGSTLVRMGFLTEESILRSLSAQLRLPSVDFQKVAVSPEAKKAIDVRTADKYNVMPVAYKEELGKKIVVLAMSDPTNLDAVTEIQFQTGLTVKPVVATESSITRAIDHYYRNRPLRESFKAARAAAAEWDDDDEMIILQHGDEKSVGELDGVDVSELVRALVQVLEDKGVISAQDLQEALRRR